MQHQRTWMAALGLGFLALYFLPVGTERFDRAVMESLQLAHWYAREHVILCLVPAFFIAGAIGTFVSQGAVLRYLGKDAPKPLAYAVAAVSGTVLAVCSCTVLPLFGGIYRRGAGLGPAMAFLYAGPAINAMAIILTTRILGMELGIARAGFAVVSSIAIGVAMAWIFRDQEGSRASDQEQITWAEPRLGLLRQLAVLSLLLAILVFANWAHGEGAAWGTLYRVKWLVTSVCGGLLLVALTRWLGLVPWRAVVIAAGVSLAAVLVPGHAEVPFACGFLGLAWALAADQAELREWLESTWEFTKQILPLLLAGVLLAGLLLGRPGHDGLIPSQWVETALGGNGPAAVAWAAIAGAAMYFATLTEVPILQGLLGAGMGAGPALALLLAGPALSLPAILVLRGLVGWPRTIVYVALVVVSAAATGLAFGLVVG